MKMNKNTEMRMTIMTNAKLPVRRCLMLRFMTRKMLRKSKKKLKN